MSSISDKTMELEFTEPQKAFMKAKSAFVAYGGARGGGKSWALQRKIMLLGIKYPGIRMLLMRRTFPQIRENHILALRVLLDGIAKYKESEKSFTFVNGSRLVCGYCATETDVDQYRGQEYDIICMDEATDFTESQFTAMTACIRGVNNFPKRMYLTANPGGVGHAWYKRLFIDREYRDDEDPNDYTFIPATIFDNPYLLESSPNYLKMLKSIPDEARREAWLNGRWDVFSGQYFSMWNPDIHVMEPFQIPNWWDRFAAIDYGRDMFAAYEIYTDTEGRAYVTNEIYQKGLIAGEAAKLFKARFGTNFSVVYAPPDLWNKQNATGSCVFEVFANHGIYFYKARNDRIQGWYDLSEWLNPYIGGDGKMTAKLRIFKNCENLIRCLPLLQFDEKKVNDVATEPHELTHSCVTGDTLVRTSNGNFQIKDLVGQEGLCWCMDIERQEPVLSRYGGATITRKNADVYELELENGAILKATADHRVLTAAGWKEIRNLSFEDDLIVV